MRAKQKISAGDVLGIGCENGQGIICDFSRYVDNLLVNPRYRLQAEKIVRTFTNQVLESSSALIFRLPSLILNLFIAFFTSYYLFKDGKALIKKLKRLLPLKLHHQKHVFTQLGQTTHAIIYGSIIIALIQGALGAIGFLIVGLDSPIIWGLVMSVFALVPLVGTTIIWGPAGLLLLANGYISGDTIQMGKGIGLLIYGALVISTIDNILKPKIIGDRTQIHPVLILLGVLGGIKFFGPIGLLAGPLFLALAITFLEIYEREKIYLKR